MRTTHTKCMVNHRSDLRFLQHINRRIVQDINEKHRNSWSKHCLCFVLRFLLRWSPSFFARECPYAFQHDAETNRLSLKPGIDPPWLRSFGKGGASDTDESWLYCSNCADQHKNKSGSHIPFRDKASQQWMKRVQKPEVVTTQDETQASQVQQSLPQPEEEPEENDPEDAAFVQEDEEQEEANVVHDPPVRRPSLEEYKIKWAALQEQHSKSVPGDFDRNNLVPCPVPVLWQNHPSVPFDALQSNEAQSRLAAARPISSLQEAGFCDGVPYYAHNKGDITFRRRSANQINSTLGFVLNKNGAGHFKGLNEKEVDALHEVLTWGLLARTYNIR